MSPAASLLPYLDCLDGVLDLEDASFGREGVDAAIVIAPAWGDVYFVLNIFDIALELKSF